METGSLPDQVRTLILLVVAARNSGSADPAAAVQEVVRPSPSREVLASIESLLDTVGHEPGMPASVVFARLEGLQ